MPLISNPNDIILHEEDEVQQILGKTPGCLLYWGITFIAVAFIIVFTIGWVVEYPDTVAAPLVLTTERPPIAIVAKANGNISDFDIMETDTVAAKDLLGVIENTAVTEDVLQLESRLIDFQKIKEPLDAIDIEWDESLELGNIQKEYAPFILRYNDFKYFLEKDNVARKRNSLKRQIEKLEELNLSIEKEKATLMKNVAVTKKLWERQRDLFLKDTLVSAMEMEKAESIYIQSEHQAQSLESKIAGNNLIIEQKKEAILDLRLEENDALSEKWLSLTSQYQKLTAEVEQWKQTYLLIAPIDGIITIPQIRSEQQYVEQGETIAIVVPHEKSGQIIAKATLPNQRSGKVEENMPVKIRLNDYPYQEYGIIEGTVKNISLTPVASALSADHADNSYMVEIHLNNGLNTTYNKELKFKQGMKGIGQVVANDRSVLGRIFDKVLSLALN